MTYVTPGSAELLALATDLSNQKLGSRSRAVEVLRRLAANLPDPDAMNERRALEDAKLASNVREAAIEEVGKQLVRANKIIAWMMPYIGTMCPPQNGLGELNDHCFQNGIRPNFDDETKGRPINQSGILPNPAALSTTGEPKS